MNISSTTKLNEKQIATVTALQQKVHDFDGTFKDIYLSNQFNTEQTMATFFMGENNGELVGFLMIYADDGPSAEADLSVIVDPEKRRQGIATELIAAAKVELARFGYHKVEYVTERAFLDAQPEFLKNWQLKEDPDTDFQLSAPAGTNADYELPTKYRLREIVEADIAPLVPEFVEAFGDPEDVAERYLRAPLTATDTDGYVLTNQQGEILASVSVDLPDYYYFFALFVKKEFRHQGIGTILIRAIMAEVSKTNPLPFALAVESGNDIAHHLYLDAGMHDETEIIYLVTDPQ